MFYQRKSHFLTGMLIGAAVGGIAGAGALIMSDKKKMTDAKKTVCGLIRRVSSCIDGIMR